MAAERASSDGRKPHTIPEPWERARAQKRVLEGEIERLERAAEGRTGVDGLDFGHVFIYGCPRSGTTATAELLNRDPRIALGLERFKYIDGSLRRHHFAPEYFVNPTPDETNIRRPGLYRRLDRRLRSGEVSLVGDKLLARDGTKELKRVAEEFAGCKFIFVLRDLPAVADSFERRAADPEDRNWPADYGHEAAARRWNHSLRTIRAFVTQTGRPGQVFVLLYERFFAGEAEQLHDLYSFLELELTPDVTRGFEEAVADWPRRGSRPLGLSAEALGYLEANRDRASEQWVRDLADGEPSAGASAAGAGATEPGGASG